MNATTRRATSQLESAPASAGVAAPAAWLVWLRALRPRHWLKNAFVLAPVLFSGRFLDPASVLASSEAFVLFCCVASGIYLLNDVVDRTSDRLHPVKRGRPVAAGLITPRAATLAGIVMVLAGIGFGAALQPGVGIVLAAYFVLNVAYTFKLKHIVILDVFTIAAFFVLRLLAGTTAIDVVPSVWLLLCGGLLALFLGFAKRRHELHLLGDGSVEHRSVLGEYSTAFLDQVSGVLLAVTVVSYLMYTLTSSTAAAVGSEALSYSGIFVL
jgi:4-hydroxybenzoate polyprenyltransferase